MATTSATQLGGHDVPPTARQGPRSVKEGQYRQPDGLPVIPALIRSDRGDPKLPNVFWRSNSTCCPVVRPVIGITRCVPAPPDVDSHVAIPALDERPRRVVGGVVTCPAVTLLLGRQSNLYLWRLRVVVETRLLFVVLPMWPRDYTGGIRHIYSAFPVQ